MSKLLLSLGFVIFGFNAHAAPLVTKVNQSGHVPADYRYTETCELYRNRVVITKEMGLEGTDTPVVTRRVFPVAISQSIHQMIRQASTEEFQVSNIQVCDASTTKVSAATTGVKPFVIFQSGSCSEARAERMGGSSHQLRTLIDSFCPETNDPGGDLEANN